MQSRIRHHDAVARQDAAKNGEEGLRGRGFHAMDDRFKDRRASYDAQALLPFLDFRAGPVAAGYPGKTISRPEAIDSRKDSIDAVDRQARRVVCSKDFFACVDMDQPVGGKLELKVARPGMREFASKGHHAVGQPDHVIEDVYVAPVEVESKSQLVILRENAAAGSGGENGRSDPLCELLHPFYGPNRSLALQEGDGRRAAPRSVAASSTRESTGNSPPGRSGGFTIDRMRGRVGQRLLGPLQQYRTWLAGEGQVIRFRDQPGNLVSLVYGEDALYKRRGDTALVERLKLVPPGGLRCRLPDDVDHRCRVVATPRRGRSRRR